ncbi:hypothetical protein [Varibaculum massiliense]|uniref:hypothetical protein n=1 Tax=Varibaculum massiliense TaxID=1852372 RepID=UPI002594D129|nr:hypothetical protein [Varibaculum massiliense]
MNWINSFEIICYLLTALLVTDIVRKKNWDELSLFFSAALAGFALELLAVRLTGIYHYSSQYFISIGWAPNQFPFFGGLMWGGVAVAALRLAKKIRLSQGLTALLAGWLVVSMDLLLDVAAIRLNGGFWIWEGRPITLAINHHTFMSVIWVNFLGYLFETPMIVYLNQRFWQRQLRPKSKLLIAVVTVAIGLSGVAFVGIASAASLKLNQLTDEWFAPLVFLMLWGFIFLISLWQVVTKRTCLTFKEPKDWIIFIFWAAIYGYCLVALEFLGIFKAVPAYRFFAYFLCLLTLALSLASQRPALTVKR